MRNVAVVGTSGSGKSTFARKLAAALDSRHIELDAIWHQEGWTNPTPERFVELVTEAIAEPGWVTDGNYPSVGMDGPIWKQADAVVVLQLPKHVVMRQIIGRTLRRVRTREELWNGNREPLSNFYRWNPERNVIRWAWTHYDSNKARYEQASTDPRFAHLQFVFLRSHEESAAYVEQAERDAQTRLRDH